MLLTLAVKIWTKCHLPQGRCGLKSAYNCRYPQAVWSPSARKVWIEMYNHDNDGQYGQIVTFRKEGVD